MGVAVDAFLWEGRLLFVPEELFDIIDLEVDLIYSSREEIGRGEKSEGIIGSSSGWIR